MMEGCDLSIEAQHKTQDPDTHKLQIMLEAARRANWDALNGPKHLKSGYFNPSKLLLKTDKETDTVKLDS